MPSLQGKQILIVDDADDIRLLVRKILAGDGAEILEADGVTGALDVLSRSTPHLIVTDLEMPQRNGFELLEHRLANPALSAVPCLVLSGKNDLASVKRAVSLGAVDYLVKPFRATALLQKIRKRLKIASFLSRKTGGIPATISIQAEITRMNETGIQIESPIKLSPGQDVAVESELLQTDATEAFRMRTAPKASHYLGNGRYLSEISFIGVDPVQARSIRALLGRLK